MKMIRTEKEILKDFEKEGLKVIQNDNEFMVFEAMNGYTLTINKKYKEVFHKEDCAIVVEEIVLLHELFNCWGWLDEEKD
jgi:hypothetical protein